MQHDNEVSGLGVGWTTCRLGAKAKEELAEGVEGMESVLQLSSLRLSQVEREEVMASALLTVCNRTEKDMPL